MFQKPTNILMNEADSSPGNGAQSSAPAPAEPQAQAAPVPDLSQLVSQIVSQVTASVEEKMAAQENKIFANLRKAGALGKDKQSGESPQQPNQSAPVQAQAGLSAEDMEARMDARIELERVISSREGKYGLTEAQAKRLRASLSGVARDSLAAEADAYLADMGLTKAATQPATDNNKSAPTPAPAPPKPSQNVSDLGAAAPTNARDGESIALNRPREATGHDIEALVSKHGYAKGMQMWTDAVMRDLRSYKIVPENRRQR